MDNKEIMEELNGILVKILGHDKFELKNDTAAKDVAGWDSLSHIQLIVAAEKHFCIRFTTAEIMGLKNVGDFCQKINKKLYLK